MTIVLGAGALTGGVAHGQSDVERKRAEVERIQSELAAIDAQVEDAANAYNGARYELDQVRGRIDENQQTLNVTEKALARARGLLASRLRSLYVTPDPSIAEIIITSGSLTAATDQIELLDRVADRDGNVVTGIRKNRERLTRVRAELKADETTARKSVATAAAQRDRVAGLLRQRQSVLSQAKGDLARALEAERERERRAAEARAQAAQQRSAAVSPSSGVVAAPPSEAPSSGPAPAPPPGDSANARAASIALQYLGVPYRWGGASPSTGFDCSGLCSYVYAQVGKSVPHYTVAIWNAFPKVSRDQLQPGDMVFYRGLGHMGIYIGGGNYVHAPQTGDVVKVTPISSRSDYVGAVRP